jgi:hypothetical protein
MKGHDDNDDDTRDPDHVYHDQLIKSILDDEEYVQFMNQIESDANKYIPFSEDSLDELMSKKIQFEDEILTQLKNLNVYNDICMGIYNQIVENINSFTYFPETELKIDDAHDLIHFLHEKTEVGDKLTTEDKNLSVVHHETHEDKLKKEDEMKKEDLRKLRLRFYNK